MAAARALQSTIRCYKSDVLTGRLVSGNRDDSCYGCGFRSCASISVTTRLPQQQLPVMIDDQSECSGRFNLLTRLVYALPSSICVVQNRAEATSLQQLSNLLNGNLQLHLQVLDTTPECLLLRNVAKRQCAVVDQRW